MEKYHINSNHEVKTCRAKKRACRFGDSVHFDTEQAAIEFVEKQIAEEYGNTSFPVKTESGKKETKDSQNQSDESANNSTHEHSENTDDSIDGPTYDINASSIEKVRKSIAKANRRLERAGIQERFEIEEEAYKKIQRKDGIPFEDERVKFTLNYPNISYNDYSFQARIEEVSPGNFVAYSAPGVELEGWRPENMDCEHCNKKISRNKVYAVKDKNDEYKVVGGKCVELYTGLKPSNLWALEYNVEDDLEDKDFQQSGNKVDKTDQLLTLSYVLTKDTGYRNASFEDSTANRVSDVLYPIGTNDPVKSLQQKEYNEKILKESQKVNAEDIKKEVQEAIEDSNSDWANNLRVLLNEEYVNYKGKNTVISAMAALHKYREKKAQKPFAKGFLGGKGDKVKDVRAKVLRAEEVEENYGYYPTYATKLTMQTEDGHKVFWKTASENVPEKGDNIVFNATVKDTSTWNDVDSTRVIRAKWSKAD